MLLPTVALNCTILDSRRIAILATSLLWFLAQEISISNFGAWIYKTWAYQACNCVVSFNKNRLIPTSCSAVTVSSLTVTGSYVFP